MIRALYGTSVRGVQILNTLSSLLWVVFLLAPSMLGVTVNLPAVVLENVNAIVWLSVIAFLWGGISLLATGYKRQIFKCASLLFGALVQAILANHYVSAYPPFEPMAVVCSLLALWYVGAVLFIVNVEKLDAVSRRVV